MKYIKSINEYGIRDEYSKLGVQNFYKQNKNSYINPHLDNIHLCLDWVIEKIDITKFIDLGCGNGEITTFLNTKSITDGIGIDLCLCDVYSKNTDKKCINVSFEEIATNGLNIKTQTIICSYALHLCESSYFNNLMYNLSTNCEYFVLISPSKYPIINNDYFEIIDKIKINKSHCKIFKSKSI